MEKLSKSKASKKYLDSKYGKSEPLSEEIEIKLEEANKNANKKISRNNSVYKSSNSRSHLYSVEKNSNSDCILAMDFSKLDQEMEDWEAERKAKINLYRAFSEYILCLETQLEHEDNYDKRVEIEIEIKNLKKEQKKYEVKSMLELAVYKSSDEESKKTLEKSSFSLIKKFRKK